jgi:hypothetical protein
MKAIALAGDYVRDVSFPVGSLERAAGWKPAPVTPISMVPESFIAPRPVVRVPAVNKVGAQWDESQCGGVFDGFTVTSDADPGL